MLEVRGIHAGYETGQVLWDVDLVVPDGAVVALLGPNGAGKTTLLRVASGLLPPDRGSVLVDGHDVTGYQPHHLVKRGVCHVPEGRGVFGSLSVRNNVRLHATSKGPDTGLDDVARVFPRLGERPEQRAGTLSGGEQQMLALSRAYVSGPSVVLLDEVSMGLAPRIVDEIFEFLRSLAQRGTSLLLVEQYVKRALDLADYVYVLNRGRIEFVGEPWEITQSQVASAYLGELTA
jgi:branched-chain amino acid transport system ATP-binding protein